MTTAAHGIGLRTAITFIAVVASGCSQFAIRTDRNPATEFSPYRTFAWMPIKAAAPNDQDTGSRGLDNRIYSGIEAELQRRGYAPAQSAAADLLFTFRILKTDGYDDADIPYGAQWHRGAYLEAIHATPDSYVRGTLVVDAVDRARNELAWRGSASARLLPHVSYEKRVERVEEAIDKIFASFPSRQ